MAGNGPPPKLPDERRNNSAPRRGEWVDLEPLATPILPELSPEVDWPAETVATWAAWRKDPVTSQYSVADIAYAIDTARLHAASIKRVNLSAEVRQRMDALGLTPKGKRDLRWRIIEADEEQAEEKPKGSRTSKRRAHLTAVA